MVGSSNISASEISNTNQQTEEFIIEYLENKGTLLEPNSEEYFHFISGLLNNNSESYFKELDNYVEIIDYAITYLQIQTLDEYEQKKVLEEPVEQAANEDRALEKIFSNIDFSHQKMNVSSSFDVSKAVEYARKYGSLTNPLYPYYLQGDCTNFVSQIVHAGGIPKIDGPEATSWYMYRTGGGIAVASVPWINANAFMDYWTHVGNKYTLYTPTATALKTNAQVGDIIAYKQNYRFYHLAFVTEKKNGKIYITQHTTNLNNVDWDSRDINMQENNVYIMRFK